MVFQQAYQIRGLRPDDLSAIIEINRVCLPENYTPAFFMDVYGNCPQAFLVAEIGGQIVGYSMCRLEFGFSDFDRLRMVRRGHLVSLAVLEPHRRQGVASALVAHSLHALHSRGVKECFLEVRQANLAGVGLYRKLGFEVVRVLPCYYHDGADALLMCRRLAS